jgi:hypothetical protein
MLNKNRVSDFNRLSKCGNSQVRIAVHNFPDSIIYILGNHADFLVSGESSECERADLCAMQIKFLSNKVNSALKSDFLPESQ